MSSLGPYFNSEEEVFWGPVTAREIELDWRRLQAEKRSNNTPTVDEEEAAKITVEENKTKDDSTELYKQDAHQKTSLCNDIANSNLFITEGIISDAEFVKDNLGGTLLKNYEEVQQVPDVVINLDKQDVPYVDTQEDCMLLDSQKSPNETSSATTNPDLKINHEYSINDFSFSSNNTPMVDKQEAAKITVEEIKNMDDSTELYKQDAHQCYDIANSNSYTIDGMISDAKDNLNDTLPKNQTKVQQVPDVGLNLDTGDIGYIDEPEDTMLLDSQESSVTTTATSAKSNTDIEINHDKYLLNDVSFSRKNTSELDKKGATKITVDEITTKDDLTDVNKQDVHQAITKSNSCFIDGMISNTDLVEAHLNETVFKNNEEVQQVPCVAINLDRQDKQEDSMLLDSQKGPTETFSMMANIDIEINHAQYSLNDHSFYSKNIPMVDKQEDSEITIEELKSKVDLVDLNKEGALQNKSDPLAGNPDFVILGSATEQRNCNVQNNIKDLSGMKVNDGEYNDKNNGELTTYLPLDKKVKFNDTLKNKENVSITNSRLQKSKIPIPGSSKLPILRPSSLKVERNARDLTWSSEFKMKKIPKPKKPEYVVSPAKLGSLLKVDQRKLTRPQSAGNFYSRPSGTPLQSNTRLYNTPQPRGKPSSASSFKTPSSEKTPMKLKQDSQSSLITPPKNPKYRDIVSPVADYIHSSKTFIIGKINHSNKPAIRRPSIEAAKSGDSSPKASPGLKKARVLVTP